MIDYTADDIRRNISIYRREAEVSRKLAAGWRKRAADDEREAQRLDMLADKLSKWLSPTGDMLEAAE